MLWPTDSARPISLYAVLDGARDPAIHNAVTRSYRQKCCLFAGTLHPALEKAAPYLIEVGPRDSITDFVLLNGWENAWGILIESTSNFRDIRRHLRTFLRVKDEAGRNLLFRYYDPRVLTVYLPTCNAKELNLIFGSVIKRIVAYSPEIGSARSYSLGAEGLHVED